MRKFLMVTAMLGVSASALASDQHVLYPYGGDEWVDQQTLEVYQAKPKDLSAERIGVLQTGTGTVTLPTAACLYCPPGCELMQYIPCPNKSRTKSITCSNGMVVSGLTSWPSVDPCSYFDEK